MSINSLTSEAETDERPIVSTTQLNLATFAYAVLFASSQTKIFLTLPILVLPLLWLPVSKTYDTTITRLNDEWLIDWCNCSYCKWYNVESALFITFFRLYGQYRSWSYFFFNSQKIKTSDVMITLYALLSCKNDNK